MIRFAVCVATFALTASPAFAMDVTSADLAEGALFPASGICADYGGGNVSPALSWSGVPANAKSLALTIYDPDAAGGWWHWLVVNIPPDVTGLAQGSGSGKTELPKGVLEAANSYGNSTYDGPCPPQGSGTHHYQITLWALPDTKTEADLSGKPDAVGRWLEKHALARARLTPVYRK
ncbi:MAG TPA: YbhB/YbcL family Raf kinase inhibitor-like protein [Rhizomicrobium sp.]|nr:YbhB/YbcL family Raf kinase inhibitor-like protein [Rhizomicrobium sp.]